MLNSGGSSATLSHLSENDIPISKNENIENNKILFNIDNNKFIFKQNIKTNNCIKLRK